MLFRSYVAGFDGARPARSTIGVAALPFGGAVEIEAWAHAAAKSSAPKKKAKKTPKRTVKKASKTSTKKTQAPAKKAAKRPVKKSAARSRRK